MSMLYYVVHGQQSPRPVSVPAQRAQTTPSQQSPRSQTREYISNITKKKHQHFLTYSRGNSFLLVGGIFVIAYSCPYYFLF